MVTRWWFAHRRRGLSRASFVEHWAGPHAEIARGLSGMQRYTQYHALEQYETAVGWLHHHGCAEMVFPSEATMRRAFEGRLSERLDADEDHFVDRGLCRSVVTHGGYVFGADATLGFTVIQLIQGRLPSASDQRARARRLAGLGATSYRLYATRPSRPAVIPLSIEAVSFDTADAALAAALDSPLTPARGAQCSVILCAAGNVVMPGRQA